MRSKYVDTAAKLFCVIAALVIVWLLFEYALGVVLPFAVSFCVGVPIYKLSAVISRKIRFPRRLCAFVLTLVFLALLAALIFWAVNRLFGELEELVEWLSEDSEEVGNTVGIFFGYIGDISSKIPFIEQIENIEGLENFRETVDKGITDAVGGFVGKVTSSLPEWALGVIKRTPRALITVLVSLLSCFYFAMDYEKLREGILLRIGNGGREKAERWLGVLSRALKRYGKAYLLIMLMTFTEVFIGLLFLGKRYAFILALVIAVVDILPVLGAGTVIIPWAVVALLMKDMRTGLGLLILYGVITIVRQIAEPKIVGDSLGVHPLVTLFAMFAGLTLFGIPGMLLAPAAAMVVKECVGERKI